MANATSLDGMGGGGERSYAGQKRMVFRTQASEVVVNQDEREHPMRWE